MKFALLGIVLLATSLVNSYRFAAAGDLPQTSFANTETLEGTGYSLSSWVEENGAENEDYTATVLAGSQSLFLEGTVGSRGIFRTVSSPTNPYTVSFQFRTTTSPLSTGASTILYLPMASGFSQNAGVEINDDGSVGISHGSATANSAVSLIAANTTYYCWAKYSKSTGGNNGSMKVWISTTSTPPSAPNATITNGTSTTDIQYIEIFSNSGGARDMIIDTISFD